MPCFAFSQGCDESFATNASPSERARAPPMRVLGAEAVLDEQAGCAANAEADATRAMGDRDKRTRPIHLKPLRKQLRSLRSAHPHVSLSISRRKARDRLRGGGVHPCNAAQERLEVARSERDRAFMRPRQP